MKNCLCLFLLNIIGWTSCRQLYSPPAITSKGSFLVVEGTITGPDSAYIRLSRSVNTTSKLRSTPELNALVTIEDDQNNIYPLTEMGNGSYGYSGLTLNHSHKYHLRIKTSNAEEYLSDFVPVLDSPPIDSVSYDTNGGTISGPGLNVYVSTHDQPNNARYYRWDYQETWIFRSFYPSYFYSDGDSVRVRDLYTQNVTDCWGNDTSSNIVVGSSVALSKNVIANTPVTFVPSNSEKVESEYSILVRQYALNADGYNYYSILKKNTEQLGSIFDAQPSMLQGNIHCIGNPDKVVLGYILAGKITNQRIFISNKLLPAWEATYPYPDCHLAFNWNINPPDSCCLYNLKGVNQVDFYINYHKSNVTHPYIPISALGSVAKGFYASTQECVDCTIRGTNKRPAFWK